MSSTCYARNGSLYTDPDLPAYIPCNLTAVDNGQHSACCAPGDLCLTNGMCMNPGDEQKGANHYWRVGCTDSTFNDPACARFCTGKEDPDHYNALIYSCEQPKSYCCALPGTADHATQGVDMACCSNSSLTFQADEPLVYTTARASIPRLTSSASMLLATTATGTSVSSIPSYTALSMQGSSRSSTVLKIGLSVGLSLGLLVLVAIGALCHVLRRRKCDTYHAKQADNLEKAQLPPPYAYCAEAPMNTCHEAGGNVRVELEGREIPAEMRGQ